MINSFVKFHAISEPGRIAIVNRGEEITYATLDRYVDGIVTALSALGVMEGTAVAVSHRDTYRALLLCLALDRLAATPAPCGQLDPVKTSAIFELVGCVLSDQDVDSAIHVNTIHVDENWFKVALQAGPPENIVQPRVTSLASPLSLILHTSGSTGVAKVIGFPQMVYLERLHQRVWLTGLHRDSRVLTTMPFHIGASYWNAATSLFLGACLFVGTEPESDLDLVASLTLLCMLPVQLKDFVEKLPSRFRKPRGLTVFSLGAHLPQSLALLTSQKLSTRLISSYGSNEAGHVACLDDERVGYVAPWIDYEVVDDSDQAVPVDAIGNLRVRGAALAPGYLNEQEVPSSGYRDGWFYPGDAASLSANGQIKIFGRTDDLLNIGGFKVSATQMEELLKSAIELDLAVCAMPDEMGIDRFVVAVSDLPASPASTIDAIHRSIGKTFGDIEIVSVASIPRNASGKVDRAALKDLMRIAISKRAPASTPTPS